MREIKTIFLFMTTMLSAVSYAGNLGSKTIELYPNNVIFTGLEGAYTWADVGDFFLDRQRITSSREGWGGRVSVGLDRLASHDIRFSSEAGWGYFGKNTYNQPILGRSGSYKMYGFDLLFGLSKMFQAFELFAKAGAMAETTRYTSVNNLSRSFPGGLISGEEITEGSGTTVVPEVKLGGIYHVNDQFALTLAYMYLAGWSVGGTIQNQATFNSVSMNRHTMSGPPEFNTVMFGLRYYVA